MDDDLQVGLRGLSWLTNGSRPLSETLTQIAHFAVGAIPGADGAGLTMHEDGRAQTVVASAAFVSTVDDLQYGLGEGPCLLAVASRQTQTSGSLGGERRWPRFGPRVGRLGVHSALSLPLLLPAAPDATATGRPTEGVLVGALNVYARPKHAFTPDAVRIGELFAVPAAVSVHNAQVLAGWQRLATRFEQALTSRSVIDQAVGVLMSRTGATADEAFDRLRAMSQSGHVKLHVVARSVMDEAVRRARARHAGPDG